MPSKLTAIRNLALAFATTLLLSSAACAAEVGVMISGGLTAAYQALVPEFEKATGNKVITAYGPSMGTTVNTIPVRLARGEPADVLILVGYALDDLVKQGKARQIPATPVGETVACGQAEIGLQQIAELKPVAGIDIVGPLPPDLQKITVFSAGIASVSKEPEAGKALIKFLASPAARDALVKSGLEPIAH